MPEPIAIVEAFNAAINGGDLDQLTSLMGPEHRFVDTTGDVVDGIDACRAAWASFFASFPDYRNRFEQVEAVDDATVVATGRSTCSFAPLAGPAIWTARVVGDRLVEWKVEVPDPS